MIILGLDLDNRELSFLIWCILVLVFMMFRKELRKGIFQVVKIALGYKFVVIFILIAIYVLIIIFVLQYLGVWDRTLLKGTVLWALFVAVPHIFKANRVCSQKNYFRKLIKENLKVIVF